MVRGMTRTRLWRAKYIRGALSAPEKEEYVRIQERKLRPQVAVER